MPSVSIPAAKILKAHGGAAEKPVARTQAATARRQGARDHSVSARDCLGGVLAPRSFGIGKGDGVTKQIAGDWICPRVSVTASLVRKRQWKAASTMAAASSLPPKATAAAKATATSAGMAGARVGGSSPTRPATSTSLAITA